MYDCQNDSYTGFSYADESFSHRDRPLAGTLSATPLTPQTTSLRDLQRFADQAGYDTERHGDTLLIRDISLRDALEANCRFGNTLLISCDLRRDPPARFG